MSPLTEVGRGGQETRCPLRITRNYTNNQESLYVEHLSSNHSSQLRPTGRTAGKYTTHGGWQFGAENLERSLPLGSRETRSAEVISTLDPILVQQLPKNLIGIRLATLTKNSGIDSGRSESPRSARAGRRPRLPARSARSRRRSRRTGAPGWGSAARSPARVAGGGVAIRGSQ